MLVYISPPGFLESDVAMEVNLFLRLLVVDDFCQQLLECNIKINIVFCTCLKVRDAMLLSKRCCFLLVTLNLVYQVNFVSKKNDFCAFVCMFFDLFQPVVNVVKASFVCHVIDQYDPH